MSIPGRRFRRRYHATPGTTSPQPVPQTVGSWSPLGSGAQTMQSIARGLARPKSREQRRVGARPTGEAPVALRPLARASRPKPSRRKGARRTDRSFRIAACSALPGPFMATRERSSAVCAGGLVTRIRLGRAEDVRLIRSQAFHHRRICWRVDHPEMPPPGLLPVDKRNHAFQTCRLLNWPS